MTTDHVTVYRCPECHGRLFRYASWGPWRHMLTGNEECPQDPLDVATRDTLIDCLTSFDVHGDVAERVADYILSEASGLSVVGR